MSENNSPETTPQTPDQKETPPSDAVAPRKKSWRFRVLLIVWIVFYIPVVPWTFGALYFDLPFPAPINMLFAWIWLITAAVLPFVCRKKLVGLKVFSVLFLVIFLLWKMIPARNDRDWQPEFARTPHATISDSVVTIHDIRNFDYRQKDNVIEAYATRSYDLKNLKGVDLFLNYWGIDYMSHPIISFDFGAGGHITFSIETRRDGDEGFSMFGGLYKMFELIYIAADERDGVLKRATGDEQTYLYHLNISTPDAREMFMEYIKRINELHEKPEFYNALTANCTTSVRAQRSADRRMPWDWRLLVNGYLDKLLYETGMIDNSLPFGETRKKAYITEKALKAKDAKNFSEKIRK